MQSQAFMVGIILLAFGVLSLVFSFSATWMWALIFLGIIGIIWGVMPKEKEKKGDKGSTK